MKPSKHISKLARVNIVKKRQRTFLSLIAISLSVAIIFTSLTLFVNVFSLTKQPNRVAVGEYHYIFKATQGEPLTRHQATYDYELNTATTYNEQTYVFHQIVQESDQSALPFNLTEGRLAENKNELVVPSSMGLTINQSIDLEMMNIESGNLPYEVNSNSLSTLNLSSKYTVVGLYETTELYASLVKEYHPIYTFQDNLNASPYTLILRDDQVQRSDSLAMIGEIFDVDAQEIQMNNMSISYDTVKNYLKDTTTLLVMFVAIVLIAVCMSLISLKNVFIISDKDRKKEFGLLKSIGATPKDIKRLLNIELSILGLLGASIGIIFGILISNVVLKMFIKQLLITFEWGMILNPFVLGLSFVVGFLLMYVMGNRSYKHYIHSNAIDDLKDVSYNYDPPRQRQSYMSKSFSWKMFLIYNGRLKKQTKNIFQSFALLILTTVIFFAVFLSNFSFKNETANVDYDFSIENKIPLNSATPVNTKVYDELYDAIDRGDLIPSSMDIKRQLLGPYVQYPKSALVEEHLKTYNRDARVNFVEGTDERGIDYGQVQSVILLLDEEQLTRLKPYVIAGSLDSLSDGGSIAVVKKGSPLSEGLFSNLKVGDRLYLNTELNFIHEDVEAIVAVESGAEGLYSDYDEYERIVAMDYKYAAKYQENYVLKENAKINLDNEATLTKASLAIDKSILNAGAEETYTYDNVLLRAAENKVTSFMIESLLYPLFFLLFIISVLNINNVLVGNVHLKRGDISIMKSVGMTSYQLYILFVYEYLEGYINASAIVTAIFIPICILESKLKLTSAFRLGENIFMTLILSIMIVDILLVTILVVASLNNIRRVQAIENMKDVV